MSTNADGPSLDGSIDRFKAAVYACKADQLSDLLRADPRLTSHLNDPLFHFDCPAIVQAAGSGCQAIVDVLLDAGAEVNARSGWWAGGFGVLDLANPELAAHLIERGATLDAHSAARLGRFEQLKELIASKPELVHARGGDGQTPLHFASTVEIAGYLLAHGAPIDAVDVDHESTPAQYLVRSHPDVVRYLISQGCRTDILMAAAVGDPGLVTRNLDRDPECIRMRVNEQYFPKQNPRAGGAIYIWTLGMNLLPHQVARRFGQDAVLALFTARSSPELQLVDAFAASDETAVRRLLAAGSDLLKKLSPDERRQISYTARDNNSQAVELMLEYGWPLDDGNAETPLHWAAFHGNARMVTALLERNAPLESRDPVFHGTPLGWAIHGSEHGWFAATGEYAQVVEALLRAGAISPGATGGSQAVREVLLRSSPG